MAGRTVGRAAAAVDERRLWERHLELARIGLEKGALFMPVVFYERLHEALPYASLADGGGLVERLRA